MLDEHKTDPDNVHDYDGQPLTTVIDSDALKGRMLHIFSDRQRASEYSDTVPLPKRRVKPARPAIGTEMVGLSPEFTPGVPPKGGYIQLWQDVNFTGCYWRLLEGLGVQWNYDQIWACGFLWWGWINAIGRVSSIESFLSADKVVFSDSLNVGMTGSWLTVSSGVFDWPDQLVTWGWNDRIQSHGAQYVP